MSIAVAMLQLMHNSGDNISGLSHSHIICLHLLTWPLTAYWKAAIGFAHTCINPTCSCADNVEEGIQNVLRPDTQRIAMWVTYSYWSSAASDDADSTETLDFELAHPLCLATEVHIRPFRADFQDVRLICAVILRCICGLSESYADCVASYSADIL